MKKDRIRLTLFLFLLFFLSLIVRFFYLQVIVGVKYSKLAYAQRSVKIPLLAKRGSILDRNYQEIAVSTEKQTVYANPRLIIKDHEKVARNLASILKSDYDEMVDKITSKTGFVYLKRKVDLAVAKKIKKLNIEGIGLIKEQKRQWPSGSVAPQVIGFVGTDDKGLSGLEMSFNQILSGKQGEISDERNPLGQVIPGTQRKYIKPQDGKSLTLTIDREIQYKAQVELESAVERWQAKGGTIIIMNPKNGEIYAMANYPTFDITNFSKANVTSTKNAAVVNVYEPGSTIKAFTAAKAIDMGLYSANSRFFLEPTINIGGAKIGEAHSRDALDYNLTEIIANSSNVGISKIAAALGKKNIYKFLEDFGFTQKTGILFPGETKGFILTPDQWYGPTFATVSFGQGMSVTPLQVARGYCIIANGGTMIKPILVKEVISQNGKVKKYTNKSSRQVIKKSTSWEMIKILEKTVSNGTGKEAAIANYRVAGKTGTSQVPDKEKKGYAKGKYDASFAGFAPAENAEVMALVVINEPTKAIYGSAVAAPVFKNVVEFSLQRLRIPPG